VTFAQRVGFEAIRAWEEIERPYGLRTYLPNEYTVPSEMAPPWDRLGDGAEGKRALLFVHGTFLRAHEIFNRLDRATMTALAAAYGDRLFAFDHFTLTDDPRSNAEWFAKGLGDRRCEIDVVCHSRGGLVARALATIDPARIVVRRIAFVGCPNGGTALADPARVAEFVDVWTHLLSARGHVAPLAGLVHFVTARAEGVALELPGILAQRPGSPFLFRANDTLPNAIPNVASMFAVASRFDGAGALPVLGAISTACNALFEAHNDLVVPTDGVHTVAGTPLVPASNRLLFDRDDHVDHMTYFDRAETRAALVRFFAR
jgi:pimeloyl-ACP methyl ester carboxylesterase